MLQGGESQGQKPASFGSKHKRYNAAWLGQTYITKHNANMQAFTVK